MFEWLWGRFSGKDTGEKLGGGDIAETKASVAGMAMGCNAQPRAALSLRGGCRPRSVDSVGDSGFPSLIHSTFSAKLPERPPTASEVQSSVLAVRSESPGEF